MVGFEVWLVWKGVCPSILKKISGRRDFFRKMFSTAQGLKIKKIVRLAKIILCSEGIENDWRWFDAARRLWRPRRLFDW